MCDVPSSSESVEFRNAVVLDGTGGAPFEAHVHVADGRIQRVSDEPAGADREIDLDGSYLAPGFVDMHAHSELRLLDHPEAAEKLTQGVTTEVLGQDGVSVAPIPERLKAEWADRLEPLDGATDEPWPWVTIGRYLTELEAAEPAVNVAYYAPHGNLRSLVAEFEDRELSDWEVETLREELHKALDAGAFGLSTGMIYPPSSYGRDDELEALATALGRRKSFMVSHVWNETDQVVGSIERFIDICRRGGCQAHISHLKVGGQRNWGKSSAIVTLLDAAESSHSRVTFDQYPYTAGSTMLTALLPPWARQGDSEDIKATLQREEDVRRIADDIGSEGDWENLARAAGTWENILITRTKSGAHQGNTIAEIAEARDAVQSAASAAEIDGVDPVEVMCELLVEEDLDVTMGDFIMSEEDIERFIADERGTFCTDGIFGGKPHPRAIGTFGRILERYVREREVIPVETMVYKAAGHPADILGLDDRGYVREGNVADLVAFDLADVSENATYEEPYQLTDGMEYVLVGGSIAVEDGEPTGVAAGEVLRSTEEWGGDTRPYLDRHDPDEA